MIPEPKILRRFEKVRTDLRRYQGWLGLAATGLTMAVALGLLAWLDYRQELPRTSRMIGLSLAVLAVAVVVARWLVAPQRWWTQNRTAAEIEARFPELGQRIRTVVQYAGLADARIEGEGVRPSLVEALHDEAEGRAGPLPIGRVVPWRRAVALSAVAAIPALVLATLLATNPEWRIATSRALLIERAYTTVEVHPGNILIEQGQTVPIAVEIHGRPRKSLALLTRPGGKPGAPWKREPLNEVDHKGTLAKVQDPLEYQVEAGPATSPTYAIRVRYPLAIRSLQVEVIHPSYTGLPPKTTRGGDVQAVEGSVASFRISLDGTPTSEAALELVELARKGDKKGVAPPGPVLLPLTREPGGGVMVARLNLTRSLDYRIKARTSDGRVLPDRTYRIDVREDRAPRVAFR